MSFVIKTAKIIRNNWKKSAFGAVVVSYGVNYAKNYFDTQELMRAYCERAAKYGEQTIAVDVEPRSITVILNPNANRRKASDDFEKYCAPILHLAGMCVNILKTGSEGHARTMMSTLESTDAIVVAGGDGTLSEVITGLLRRTQENTNGLIPIGVLPLGKTNTVAQFLFPFSEKVKAMVEATMAVVEEVVKPIDVLRVEVIEGENKPIYAVAGIKWGAYRDAESKKDSYWLYGSWRKYATYLFNGYRSWLSWKCEALLRYSPPCLGCSNCIKSQTTQDKWFQRFAKEKRASYFHVLNPECQNIQETNISTVDFNISIANNTEITKLLINVGPESVSYFNFVKEGWRSENGKERVVSKAMKARTVELHPKERFKGNEEAWLSIDNESYELKPIRVTLMPKLVKVFCNNNSF